ncbi:MAG: alkaline phosphatase family protein [Chloroflexota bacterium]|nr:MAG: alkaline phosphatase family protein [Chloroflexota bacterium]
MPDLTSEILPRLRSHSLKGIDLWEGLLHPDYEGRSLLNVPASICQWLGVPPLGARPLDAQISQQLGGNYKNVILILIDALGLERLLTWLKAGSLPVWARMVEQGVLAPLTSIMPSTTAAALPTLWTGTSAAAHGIVGYEMWLKEYGMVINAILHSPMSYQGEAGSLRKAGFVPQNFLETKMLGTHLTTNGIQVHAFQHRSITYSGLSQMLLRDVSVIPFHTQSDLWVNVRNLLEREPDSRKYIWIYWGELDYLSHHYGPNDSRAIAELVNFSSSFEFLFLNQLKPHTRDDTLLILIADHGQIKTEPDPHYDLSNHPNFVRRLHMMPTGENRLAYLFIRPGQTAAIREYIERTWPGQFSTIEPALAVEYGLFGPGEVHPRLFDRLGDLILVSRQNAYLWWSAKPDHLLGRHGGLSSDEILIPFLAAGL